MTGSIAQPVLIAAATWVEARPLLLAQSALARAPQGCFRLPGALADVWVLVAGVGRSGDPVLERALAELQPRTVVNLGYAGGLVRDLTPGDVVLSPGWILGPDLAPDPTLRTTPDPLLDWVRGALEDRQLVPRVGPLLTLAEPFHDRSKSDQPDQVGAAVAVEMESARWARLATAAGADFVSLRVISDRADLRLPDLRHRLLRPNGTVRWTRWLGALARTGGARYPWQGLQQLRRARVDWIAAGQGLEQVCAALVGALGAESRRPS